MKFAYQEKVLHQIWDVIWILKEKRMKKQPDPIFLTQPKFGRVKLSAVRHLYIVGRIEFEVKPTQPSVSYLSRDHLPF